MSKKKELLKNTFIIFIGKTSTQLISFFLLPLYTAYLSKAQYGVVDLIQNDGKKHNYKYLIKKMTRPIGKQIIHNNPKYREQAAKLIKEWWFAVKEYKEKRNESATLIQSYFRGRFVRKYLYYVIYMNYIYFGFCKKIEKFIKKKYGPYFFKAIFAKFIKQKSIRTGRCC